LLTTVVLSGGTVSASHLLRGLRDLLTAAEAKAWMIEERRGELEDWLALFPFSDNPEALFEAFTDVPAQHRRVHRLERALAALGATPDDRAAQILHRLARELPEVMNGHAWIDALNARPPVEAARVILDLTIGGMLPKEHLQYNAKAQHILAAAVNRDPAFRAELYDRHRTTVPSDLKAFFSHVIAEVPDADGILELVEADGKSGRPFGGPLQLALDSITRREEPGSGSTFYIYSRPLPELRKGLFALTVGGSHRAVLARLSLEMIDHARDMYGPVETEPRHPDILSGRPWPILN